MSSPLDLKDRTKAFALRIIKLYCALPKTTQAQVLGKQLLRSGTSVGAHYYEAQHAKSDADFVSKIEGATQECEETRYWLDLLQESGIVATVRIVDLQDEARQLIAIFVSIAGKMKRRKLGVSKRERTNNA